MTQLAADDFDRADGGLGANWAGVPNESALAIISNECYGGSAAVFGGRYTATAAPNDGYAEIVVGSVVCTTSDEGIGPAYRISSVAQTHYLVQTNQNETRLYRVVSGSYAQLGTDGAACVAGDVLRLTCNGTSISVQRNGTTFIGPVTDANIASGAAGIWAAASSSFGRAASWAMGDLNVAAPTSGESDLASRRNRPGRGPYSQGRYFRQRVDAMGDPAFGADVSVALTGQSATASAGTLGHTHAKALTGSAATVSQGTLTPLLSLALVGSSVSSAAGSLDNATSVGLTGIGLTIAQGSVGAGADVTRALTGQSVTVSAGSVGPVISKALTGISLTASAGTVSPATQVAIAGQSVTVSQGTITAQGNVTVALTGQSVTVSVGSLVPQLTKALTGGQVTSSSGSLGASTSVALTGQSLSTAQGTLTAAATGNVTVALTGIEMRLYAGTIGTLGGDVAEKIGGDDVPMPSPHRGWDRRRSELKRTEEQKFLADIRRIYRDLVEEPSVADRAIEAVVQSHPEVAKQTRSANGVAEKARIAKITRRTDDLELSLRMLAQELIEFRAAAELDDERVIMRALSELL